MKGDYLRDMRVNDGVSLRGHVSKFDGDKVLITFPEINSSVWVWERNAHQDFFVRSTPPAVRRSYDALKYAAERQKAELEAEKKKRDAAETLLSGIRYNMEHLEVELTDTARLAMKLATMLSDTCDDMLADKIGGGYPKCCITAASRANNVAAGCLDALETIKLVMNHYEQRGE